MVLISGRLIFVALVSSKRSSHLQHLLRTENPLKTSRHLQWKGEGETDLPSR